MPAPNRKPFYLCSGPLRRQVGFVQDQLPDGFVLQTVCRVCEAGKSRINWTDHFAYYHDAKERLEAVQAILRNGLVRGVLRLMKEQECTE